MNDELKEIGFFLRLLIKRIENIRYEMTAEKSVLSIMKLTNMVFQMSDIIEQIEDDKQTNCPEEI